MKSLNIENNNTLIAEFMGWEYFPKSKTGIDGYPFGGHEGFEVTSVWILKPTELYKSNPCHYHYGEIFGYDIDQEQLFKNYSYSLKFHESWDWLMPVVEKIELLDITYEENPYFIEVSIDSQEIEIVLCPINNTSLSPIIISHSVGHKMEALYKACVEFIKWYNNEGKNS